MDIPILGTIEAGLNWPFSLLILGIVALAATAFKVVQNYVKRVPGVGSILGLGGGAGLAICVGILFIVSAIAPGGALNPETAGASSTHPGSLAATAGIASAGFDPNLYEPTSDVSFSAADAKTKNAISPSLKLYPSAKAVGERDAYTGSATPEYTVTLSSGEATKNGIQVQTFGCMWDVYADLSGYYQTIKRSLDLCRTKNVNGVNDVAVPTIYLEKFGTLSLTTSLATLTCSAGSQCSYSLVVRNTAADTYLHRVAVKFVNVANATLDSVDSGQRCEIVEVSGTQYLSFMDTIGPQGLQACSLKITRSGGSANGSFTWTGDDNFRYLESTGWNTNIRGAPVADALTVSFA